MDPITIAELAPNESLLFHATASPGDTFSLEWSGGRCAAHRGADVSASLTQAPARYRLGNDFRRRSAPTTSQPALCRQLPEKALLLHVVVDPLGESIRQGRMIVLLNDLLVARHLLQNRQC